MKTLYLIRHAKSSWSDLTLDDFDRPLNKRGKRDAPLMAQWLDEHIDHLDQLISSSAKRAKATAKQFSIVFGIDVEHHKSLYHAGEAEIYSAIYGANEASSSIAVFGHNPGFTYFANKFVDGNDFIDNVPTCGIVAISSNAKSWAELSELNSSLKFFMYPKKLSIN